MTVSMKTLGFEEQGITLWQGRLRGCCHVLYCDLGAGNTGGELCKNSSSYTFMISELSVCILNSNKKLLKDICVLIEFYLFVCLFVYLFIYFYREEGKEKERETSMCGCLLCTPYWGPGPQPRHVP